ncbi:MAG: Ig-like domain-containing protein, partial [Actinomycetota bacterium]|nr:Ig-like domain-containing protein [Actinomycetota bacterium]
MQHADLAGNTGSASTSFIVDDSTPIVSIGSPTASALVSTSIVPVSYSVTDDNPAASSSCSVDGGSASACSSPFQTAALSDGGHTVTVNHTDAAGNTGSAAVSFTVDTTAPGAPTITDAPADPIASDQGGFAFSAVEPGGTFECSIDGGAFATCLSPVQYLGLTDGDHEFRVIQRDQAGNVGAIATHNWTIDTIAPNAPTLNGPSANTNVPESTVSFAGSPDTVELRCSFDGGAFASCPTSPLSLGELNDGNHSFSVEAFDAAGNSSTSTISWNVDTVAPGTPTITSGPVGSVPSPDAQFAFTGAESGGIYRCSIDALPAANCSSPHEITGLADGTYSFHVRQVDAAGNAGPVASRSWTVDTTPPTTPTVTGPSSPSGQTAALIDFSSAESGVTFECAIDGGGYTPCTDPLSLTGLSDGLHTVEVRAFDAAGNGSAPGTFTWEVDSALFTADISGAPSGVVNAISASLTLSASLPGSTFECSFDGSSFAACTSPISLSGLAEGPHSFSARAINGSQTTPDITRSWSVDLTNPGVSISAPLASSTTGASTAIIFTTSDLNAPISTTCKLDGASAAPCASPHPYTNLSEGNHTVTATATDAAGNSGTALVTWHVDHTAPAAPQITQPATNGSTNNATPTIGGTAEAG